MAFGHAVQRVARRVGKQIHQAVRTVAHTAKQLYDAVPAADKAIYNYAIPIYGKVAWPILHSQGVDTRHIDHGLRCGLKTHKSVRSALGR
jgi:hypothetical protein